MPPAWKRGVAAALLVLALVEPAAARGRSGRTSSAEIRISVSVAPKFGLGNAPLLESRPNASGPNFCLVANGQPTLLPILLVRPAPGQGDLTPDGERSTALAPCGPDGQMASGVTAPIDAGAPALMLSRPE